MKKTIALLLACLLIVGMFAGPNSKFAVFLPTPGILSSSFMVPGTLPPYSEISI